MKVLVHDGIGVWLAARRLSAGRFVWPPDATGTLSLSPTQFNALVLGLHWKHVGEADCTKYSGLQSRRDSADRISSARTGATAGCC